MNKIQYTIRNIPPATDRVLRKRARQTGKSFNHTVVETINRQLFGNSMPAAEADNFDWLYGSMALDADFDEAIRDQSSIDEKLWR